MTETTNSNPNLAPDDLNRALGFTRVDGEGARHIGMVGATYTITVAGRDTNGRFCVIDMHVPPGGGPPAHRHDFEETFILLEGEVRVTFRGQTSTLRAGDTVNVPSNAPHHFRNESSNAARMICICSPAGTDEFFQEIGVPVATRTTPAPALEGEQMADFLRKVKAVAPKYRTEILQRA
jgi:quercetin dioxygenase-like cupin family protein